MLRTIERNAAFFTGLAGTGWLCALARHSLVSPRGTIGPTILHSQSPGTALFTVFGCLVAAAVVAGIVGRITNAAIGLFVLGFGVYVLAGRMGTVAELAFAHGTVASNAPLISLGLESLLWALMVLLATLTVFLIAGPFRDIEPDAQGERPRTMSSSAAMRSAAAGLVVIPVVMLLAASPMKGQMIGATFVGSLLAGLIGRLISPHVQPVLLFASPIVFGAVGHFVGAALIRQPLDVAFVEDSLHAVNLPMPADYAAGALMGVAVGLGWARSFLHHEEHPAAAATA